MKQVRKIIKIDEELCDGCGQCVPACAEGSIKIVDGKARLAAENLCDGLGACLGDCPKGAISLEEREADAFDENAVAEHLAASACQGAFHGPIQQIEREKTASSGKNEYPVRSMLDHWPVQINLVPAHASFLKDADLLVTADCVPVAYPSFHRDFLDGKIVMLGCPKFDDKKGYLKKFTDIFKKNKIRSITVLDMEVPCCSSLPGIVKKALEDAGVALPVTEVTISTAGEILSGRPLPTRCCT